jgi:glycosyltransferase involved in cell wall biosynthesis
MYDLVVDARMQRHGGIGTYLQNLLPFIEKSGLKILKIESQEKIYSIEEQIKLPWKIPRTKLFWSPHFNVPLLPIFAKKRLVTIHDFYHLAYLKQLSLLQKTYAQIVIAAAMRKSSRLIVGSAFTKQELYRFFPRFSRRVDVVLYGPGAAAVEGECEAFSQKLPSHFFLFVGNLKPHKNLETLVRAFGKLNGEQHLVVVGKQEGFIRGINWEKYCRVPNVHFLGQVRANELTLLYRRANALVFPSFYEGWGFPPLEAMAQGCPVIAAKAASIPEACGEAAMYFDPQSAQQLTTVMGNVEQWREQCIVQGKKQVEKFCWKRCAEQHLEIFYEELK